MSNKTFAMIKPDAVRKNYTGKIIDMILDAGFEIKGLRMTNMSAEKASVFYAIHKDKFFFGELLDYITSGPIVVLALSKENAVEEFRKLIGSTDPLTAEEGTIRKKFGESKSINSIHGSDSDENAAIEIALMFDNCL